MNSHRTTAIIVGVLFIVATAFFVIGQATYEPIIGLPDYLDQAHPDRATVIAGVLLELIGVLAIPLIAVFLFPILRNHNEALALGYLVLRLLEAALLIVAAINVLSLINVSQDYLNAGGVGASHIDAVGSSIKSMSDWAFLLSVALVFPLGALVLYSLLYRARLVPRFISVWGLLAAGLLLAGGVLDMFDTFSGMPESALELVLTTPIAVNEMVLALWLIVKGFSPTAVTTEFPSTRSRMTSPSP